MIGPGAHLPPSSLAPRFVGASSHDALRGDSPSEQRAPVLSSPPDATDLADPHWSLAGRLLDAHDVPREQHLLLRENLATYLSQVMPADDARSLDRSSANVTAQELLQDLASSRWASERWTAKIERDLHAPYTDQEVVTHLADLDRQLAESCERILASATAPFPLRLYVAGSLAKGRFGARSDADVMVAVPDPGARTAAHREFLDQREDGISLSPLPAANQGFQDFVLMMAGPRIEVADASTRLPGARTLQDAYAGVLERKGLRLSQDDDGHVQVERISSPPSRSPEVPNPLARAVVNRVWNEKLDPAAKLEMMEHPHGLKGYAIRAAGTLVGATAAIPGPVGAVMRGIMDQFVRQSGP